MRKEHSLTAVILAGSSPQEADPLAAYSSGLPKGLIPIAGQPMITYVVKALASSRYVEHIAIVGLPPEKCPTLVVPVTLIPPQGDVLANADAGIRHALTQPPHPTGVLISGCDLPLLTSSAVDQFVQECLGTDHDIYYGIVERSVMESRFPTSRRTYVRLTDGEFAGGDLLLVRSGVIAANQELWRRLATARKNPMRQARMVGFWPLIKLLTHRMSLAEAERQVSRALKVDGRAVICPCAEVGMDVDKPFHLEIVRAELESQPLAPPL
jgi:CTP:molybdopterin cytidylyltransferase MocA